MQNFNSKVKIDLKARCYQFSLDTIALTDKLPAKRSAWVIQDQLIRSATSVGANLFEAGAASSRLEYKRYYEISLKSANETKYWLNLLKDIALVNDKSVDVLIKEVNELANMLAAGVLKLKSRKV